MYKRQAPGLARIRLACIGVGGRGFSHLAQMCGMDGVEIARILQEEGYIWNYEVTGEGTKKQIKVKTKFCLLYTSRCV